MQINFKNFEIFCCDEHPCCFFFFQFVRISLCLFIWSYIYSLCFKFKAIAKAENEFYVSLKKMFDV